MTTPDQWWIPLSVPRPDEVALANAAYAIDVAVSKAQAVTPQMQSDLVTAKQTTATATVQAIAQLESAQSVQIKS